MTSPTPGRSAAPPLHAALTRGADPGASPCTQVCRLDAREVCIGCLRTIDEIARWSSMSAAERTAVSAALPLRRAAGIAETP